MNFTETQCMCYDCAKHFDREGYGSRTVKVDEKYSQNLMCEKCGKLKPFLLIFAIPEKDIRFPFHLSYMHSSYFHVKVDGRFVLSKDSTKPMNLEYIKDVPYLHDLKMAKELYHFNVHDEKDLYLNLGAWANTVHWEYSDELVPDDILDAFKIFTGIDSIRRAIYRSEMVACEPDDPEGTKMKDGYFKWINQRVEYY